MKYLSPYRHIILENGEEGYQRWTLGEDLSGNRPIPWSGIYKKLNSNEWGRWEFGSMGRPFFIFASKTQAMDELDKLLLKEGWILLSDELMTLI